MKHNGKTIIVMIALCLFIISSAVPLFSLQPATVKDLKGKVELKPPGRSWIKAFPGARLEKGTTISTGFNASAVLDLGASVIEVKALTRMTLEELLEQEGEIKTDLFLDVGRVKAEVKSAEGLTHNFTLKSTVSTASVRGTTIEGDGEEWGTDTGSMTVSNNVGQTTTVSAGQQTVVTGNAPPSTPDQVLAGSTTVSTYTNPTEAAGASGGGGDTGEDDGDTPPPETGGAAPPPGPEPTPEPEPEPTTTNVTITWE